MLFTSPPLLAELREVLARPHLASRLEQRRSSVEQALALYGALTVPVIPASVPRVVPGDPDDDHVVAAAVAARVDMIVTGDRDLLGLDGHAGLRIVTPDVAIGLIGSART